MLDERELLRQAKGGRREAFEALVGEYQNRIYRFIVHMIGREQVAEDLTQETFLKAVRGFPRFELREQPGGEGSPFGAWLFTIARNTCRDWIRRREPLRLEDPEDLAERPVAMAEEEEIDPGEWERRKEELARAVESLPPAQREVVKLRIHSGLRFEEIAEVMSAPLGTTLARMHYALGHLRRALVKPSREVSR